MLERGLESTRGGGTVLSQALEARLRRTLEAVIEESRKKGHEEGAVSGPKTMATIEVGSDVVAVVRIHRRPASLLSQRQLEISLLVAQGLTNKEIAQSLRICGPTVAAHLQRIFRKLEITTRAALAATALLLAR